MQLVPEDRAADRGAVAAGCSTGTTRCATGSSALKRLLWKLLRKRPCNWFVPDFVIAFTCTPVERPCVASNWFGDELELGDRVLAEARLVARAELRRHLLSVEIQLELALLRRRSCPAAARSRWSTTCGCPARAAPAPSSCGRAPGSSCDLPRIDVAAKPRRRGLDERRFARDASRFPAASTEPSAG